MANQFHQHLDGPGLDDGDDARIKMMLESVPVPANLNERIKSRLRDALLVDAGKAAGLKPNDAVGADVEMQSASDGRRALDDGTAWEGRSKGEGRVARAFGERTRRVLVMMALAATLAGLAFLANRWRQPNEREWLVQHCQSILGKWELDNPANLDVEANLTDLPSTVREQLARVTLRGTRSIAALSAKSQGTLYRLDAADGHSLILLRLSELPAVRGLTSRFSSLLTPSGGWSLVALQLNNETFVLAVEGTEQQLMNYIRRPVVT